MQQQTDHLRAIRVSHLSPTWVEQADAAYGKAKVENGGFFELHAHFEEGKPRPKWVDVILRFLPWKY